MEPVTIPGFAVGIFGVGADQLLEIASVFQLLVNLHSFVFTSRISRIFDKNLSYFYFPARRSDIIDPKDMVGCSLDLTGLENCHFQSINRVFNVVKSFRQHS